MKTVQIILVSIAIAAFVVGLFLIAYHTVGLSDMA